MDFLFWGIVSSVLGGFAVLAFQWIVSYVQEEGGPLTGEWVQFIPAQKEEPEKHDIVHCRDKGSKLRGWIERVEPTDQSFKKWRFQGQRKGSLVFLTFCTTDRERNPSSYGTIQLHMAEGNHLRGFYVKLIVNTDQSRFTGQLEQFNLEWRFHKKAGIRRILNLWQIH